MIPDTPVVPDTPMEIPETFALKNGNMYVTDIANSYTSSSGSVKKQLKLSSNKSEAAVMTLVENSDNTVSIKYGSKFLLADGTNVEFVSTQSDNTKFVLESTSGGYFVKCATATYNSKPQYLEVFKENLTCYGMGPDTSIYTFVFESAEGSATNPDSGETPTPDTPDTPVTPDKPVNPPVGEDGKVATFDLGANGAPSHVDGEAANGSAQFTSGSYTLTLSGLNRVYIGATDKMGNSCIKVGTSSGTGSLSFTVGDDVDKVVLQIAKYKAKNSRVSINGVEYDLTTASDDGEYTAITVDTSSTKTVTLNTVGSTTARCMINTIEFFQTVSEPDINDPGSNETDTETNTPDKETDTETNAPETDTTEHSWSEWVMIDVDRECRICKDCGKYEYRTVENGTEDENPTDTETEEKEPEVSTESDTEEKTETPAESDTDEQEKETSKVEKPNVETNAPQASAPVTEEKSGCGSSIAGSVIIISITSIAAFSVMRKKKED